jgi:hypothetical protein
MNNTQSQLRINGVALMQHKWTLIALIASLSPQANATLILDDGNTHLISDALFDDVRLENGSSLHVTQGGSIETTPDQPAILTEWGGSRGYSTVTLSGNANVTGGIQTDFSHGDTVNVSDDAQIIAQGETSSGQGRGAIVGAEHVMVSGNGRLVGADNATNGGDGIYHYNSGNNTTTLDGGEIIGGNGGETGGNGIYGWIEVLELDMTEGTIQGGDGNTQGGHGAYSNGGIQGSLTGGDIRGGSGETGGDAIYSNYGGLYLDISGGTYQGGSGDNYGGSAIYGDGDDYGFDTTISGGIFDAGSGLLDDGWLLNFRTDSGSGTLGHVDITGGQFGYNNVGNGFGIFDGITADVHGWDLELNDNLLTGYLLDGSWIETPVSLAHAENAPMGSLNLINYGSRYVGTVVASEGSEGNVNVPEPGSMALLAIGLTGAWVTRRRKTLKGA